VIALAALVEVPAGLCSGEAMGVFGAVAVGVALAALGCAEDETDREGHAEKDGDTDDGGHAEALVGVTRELEGVDGGCERGGDIGIIFYEGIGRGLWRVREGLDGIVIADEERILSRCKTRVWSGRFGGIKGPH
jgi:hypothetical protein